MTGQTVRPPRAVAADRQVVLADGRRLVYSVYGDADGSPVLYLHGFPGSRLEAGLSHDAARCLGLRLVAPDRPGIGRSDPFPGRFLADWAEDVRQLADTLGWDRFPVLGVSGGGPYALACAARLGERIERAGLVAGMAPVDNPAATRGMPWPARAVLLLARYWPLATQWILRGAAAVAQRNPHRLPREFAAGLPAADQAVLRRPEVSRLLRESLGESFRQGPFGNREELRILARPWGFPLTAIASPVRLWHGKADVTVPAGMGRYLAWHLPRCDASLLPGEGHFSLPVNRAEAILDALR